MRNPFRRLRAALHIPTDTDLWPGGAGYSPNETNGILAHLSRGVDDWTPDYDLELPGKAGSTLEPVDLLRHWVHMDNLAAPLPTEPDVDYDGTVITGPVDMGLLADAVSDGDHPVMREHVLVTPNGGLVIEADGGIR